MHGTPIDCLLRAWSLRTTLPARVREWSAVGLLGVGTACTALGVYQ